MSALRPCCFPENRQCPYNWELAAPQSCLYVYSKTNQALPAVLRLHAGRIRVRHRTRQDHQAQVQELRDPPSADRPHPGDGVREELDPHPPVVRGRHAPAGRRGDLPEHARQPAWPRRAGRRRRPGDEPDVRHHHGAHLRPGDHRAFRRQFARAGDQRPDQRAPPVPGAGRHLHLRRAPRLDRRQDGGLDRRRQQHAVLVAAGGRSVRLPPERVDPEGLRHRHVAGRRPNATPSSTIRPTPAKAPTWSTPTSGPAWATRRKTRRA